jgi:hypothetical protein
MPWKGYFGPGTLFHLCFYHNEASRMLCHILPTIIVDLTITTTGSKQKSN